ncbi:hypothetical protein CaCOL14_007725 [Colletotrichum acutatum]|uniref:CCHC-type domain-containing protein n=1 Tax=Glomerella acutata TaxID=27357 RepID=A0AAD9D150_GLOAC|nr:uncharacterized protein BDZ83DRAFT_748308 [Colletotrichum acutatum]KAK1729566.1 hypothetical protein BDZ83DRAFT_748308 [Colletotrichum acutatum]
MSDPKPLIFGVHPREFYSLNQRDIEWELTHRHSKEIDDETLLELYTKWLAKQTPFLGLTDHTASSRVIRDACDYLSSRRYEKYLVLSAFNQHKKDYLRDRPQDKRTFNLARRDIEINYKLHGVHHKVKNSSAPKEAAVATRLPDPSQPPGLSTQASEPALGTRSSENVHPDAEDSRPSRRQKFIERSPEASSLNKQKPHAGYVCNRCGIPGHFIQHCPSTKPLLHRKYVCHICGECSDHLIQDCPQKKNNTSTASFRRRPQNTAISSDDLRQSLSRKRSHSRSASQSSSTNGPYMNEERARLLQSSPGSDQDESSNSQEFSVGPLQSGSNSQPLGHRLRSDSYRPINLNLADDYYRPERPRQRIDTYRPNDTRQSIDTYRPDPSSRLDETFRSDEHSHLNLAYRPKKPERTGILGLKRTIEQSLEKNFDEKEAKLRSRLNKRRTDGRLSPWDDIERPAKRQRHEHPFAGGLPWDDVEMPPKEKHQSAPVGQTMQSVGPDKKDLDVGTETKQAGASEDIPMDTGGAMDPAEGMEPKGVTDLQWKQASIESDEFFAALGRELFFRAKSDVFEVMAVTQSNDGSMVMQSSSPPPSNSHEESIMPRNVDFGGYYSGNNDNDDASMGNALDGMSQVPSSPIEVNYGSSHTKEVIIPLQTLKPLHRGPPYDPHVLALFRSREHKNVYVNIARRRTAIEIDEAWE